MSEDWIFFPCQMGDERAFIFFDHGIKETINDAPLPFLLRIKISLKSARPDGLSSQNEFDALCALEDELQKAVEAHGAVYVGRITVGGGRYLYIFTGDQDKEWGTRIEEVGNRHGYDLDHVLKPDPAKEGYWEDLFPKSDDWQVIMDMRVLESLKKEGDDKLKHRTIDHWVYLPDTAAQERFVGWLHEEGFEFQEASTMEDHQIQVRFTHTGTVQLTDITSRTIALKRKATELGGNYDGWGCEVTQ